jgi:hypothetical protein
MEEDFEVYDRNMGVVKFEGPGRVIALFGGSFRVKAAGCEVSVDAFPFGFKAGYEVCLRVGTLCALLGT